MVKIPNRVDILFCPADITIDQFKQFQKESRKREPLIYEEKGIKTKVRVVWIYGGKYMKKKNGMIGIEFIGLQIVKEFTKRWNV